MALHHATSGEVINLRPLADRLADTPSTALFRSRHLEVFRMVLPAGKSVPPHEVAGELTAQCLEGRVEFSAEGTTQLMSEGDLVCLAGCKYYSIKALEDASCLVSIVLHVDPPAA